MSKAWETLPHVGNDVDDLPTVFDHIGIENFLRTQKCARSMIKNISGAFKAVLSLQVCLNDGFPALQRNILCGAHELSTTIVHQEIDAAKATDSCLH